MKLADHMTKPTPYVVWLTVSAAALAVTQSIDPYVFGFTAYGTAGVSIVLVSLSLVFTFKAFLWALLAALPTLCAFALLSTYKWA